MDGEPPTVAVDIEHLLTRCHAPTAWWKQNLGLEPAITQAALESCDGHDRLDHHEAWRVEKEPWAVFRSPCGGGPTLARPGLVSPGPTSIRPTRRAGIESALGKGRKASND